MDRFGIAIKVLIPILIITVISAGVTIYENLMMARADGQYREILDVSVAAALEAEMLGADTSDLPALTYRVIAEKDAAKIKQLIDQLTEVGKSSVARLDRIGELTAKDRPDLRSPLAVLREELTATTKAAMKAANLGARNTAETDDLAIEVMRKEFEEPSRNLGNHTDEVLADLRRETAAKSKAAADAVADGRTMMLIVAGVASLIGITIGVWSSLSWIARPVGALTETMERLAQRDWTAVVDGIGRRDELGRMARAVDLFKANGVKVDQLAEAERIEQLAKATRQENFEKLIRGFDTTIGAALDGLATAAGSMRSTAAALSAGADLANDKSGTVAAAAEEALANVQSAAAAADELTASIREISRQVAQSREVSSKAVIEAAETRAIVMGVAEAANQIGAVVDLISSIAGQTNLLALNATIEAARAGDAGKGFAVVASEVKSLASQTAKATEDITAQVNAMQESAKRVVDAIARIDQTIARIDESSTAIAAAIEEQEATTNEIARNVQHASQGTGEVTRNIVDVSQASSETKQASTAVLSSADDLGHRAERLRGDVSGFLGDIRAA